MKKQKRWFQFRRVGTTRVVPLYGKIVLLFLFFLLASNLATNYITLILGRAEQVKLMNQLLVKELKENSVTAGSQFEVFGFEGDLDASRQSLEQAALPALTRKGSSAFAVRPDGSFLYYASHDPIPVRFQDQSLLDDLEARRAQGVNEGPVEFRQDGRLAFGYYRYHDGWKAYLVRAEDRQNFDADSWNIFGTVAVLILLITAATCLLAVFLLRYLFRFVDQMTAQLMKMQEAQELGVLDLKGAPADDITYLGLSFNSLSSTVRNLMNIFRKFVTQDVAQRAYRERHIRLEGEPRVLTVLFTDIKGFTYMTETLGNRIIQLLNLHYDQAIRKIQGRDGIVGSIIGDALLAVFGTIDGAREQRSWNAVRAAYEIQDVAAQLRREMIRTREGILREIGAVPDEVDKVFKAVMIEVGVGIDGGEVFYGNIGSHVRMTNTVIGDNVNSASRLEGLTRVYQVPVIVSESVRDEVQADTDEYRFVELDQVQVKGKTVGKRVFWPIPRVGIDKAFGRSLDLYEQALGHYYEGRWTEALDLFRASDLPQAEVFLERINGAQVPQGWSGVWTMTSK